MEKSKKPTAQEIDGQKYIRPDMNLLYKKPTKEEFKKLKDPKVISKYQYKPKKSIYSSVMDSGKQWFYSIRSNYYKARTLKLKDKGDFIFINGKRFDYDKYDQTEQIQLKKALDSIVWFSYRKDWNPPIHGTSLTTDSGWGCMIRCGQMLYFEALRKIVKKHEKLKFSDYLKKLLILFNDNISGMQAPYSIQNIVPEAYEAFNIKPGEWFRSTSILMSIEKINEKFKPFVSKKLKVITFVESIIYINVLHEKLYIEQKEEFEKKESIKSEEKKNLNTPFDSPPKTPFDSKEEMVEGYLRPDLSKTGFHPEQNLKEMTESQREKHSMEKMLKEICSFEWDTDILLSVATRIGVNQPEKRFNGFLKEMLAMKHCVGILGGQNDKAYYIVGFHGTKNRFYYLDPHFVNPAVDPNKMELQTYLKKTIHEYSYKDMNSSIQISFLIRGKNDFEKFIKTLRKKIDIYGMDNSFITLLETNQFDMMDGGLVEF